MTSVNPAQPAPIPAALFDVACRGRSAEWRANDRGGRIDKQHASQARDVAVGVEQTGAIDDARAGTVEQVDKKSR